MHRLNCATDCPICDVVRMYGRAKQERLEVDRMLNTMAIWAKLLNDTHLMIF